MSTELKLHLGCGDRRLPGFVNIDIRKTQAVDLEADISKHLPFEPDSVDVIYSCANIEHFGRHEWVKIVTNWFKLLKPGGVLRLSTADFRSVCEDYMERGNIEELLGFVVGGQKNNYDWHGMIFDFELLNRELKKIGFEKIERYDWSKTSHWDIDDYSSAYLPHMDKENGKLMMLNIEATKNKNKE